MQVSSSPEPFIKISLFPDFFLKKPTFLSCNFIWKESRDGNEKGEKWYGWGKEQQKDYEQGKIKLFKSLSVFLYLLLNVMIKCS